MSSKMLLRLSIIALFAAAIAAYFVFDLGQYLNLETLHERRDQLLAFTESNLLIMIAGYMLVYIVMAALSVPGAAVLTLAGGALFGVLIGTVAVSFASTIGATLVFLAARFLFRDSIQQRFGKRLKAINAGVERDGGFYLLALRLVPVFPFWLINLLMALTPIRTWTYFWVSQLGMLPATVVYVNAGTQLAQIDEMGDILSPGLIGAFVLLGLLPLLLRWILGLLKRRKVYRGYSRPASFDYNLVVIGAGAAGLVSAYIGATVKARVALIEKNAMGGDCLNTGCIPSKALLRTARLMAEARDSQRYGVRRITTEIDFSEVMARVHEVIGKIAPHDSPERYRGMGVDVIEGKATLVSPWEVEVNGKRLSARSIVLATGAEPLVPPIDGLDGTDFLTSDTLWDLKKLPERLVVLGGGPIGSELAQAFARLGSKVTVVEMAPRLLPREDKEAGELLAEHLERDGATVATAHKALRIEHGQRLVCEHKHQEVVFEFDRLLVALGRKTRVDGYGLENIGVRLDARKRIETDGFQRTNFPNIYVCGDAAGPYQFTHIASHQAWSAAVNALISPFWSFRTSYRALPWVTFTDPEVARVGLSEDEAVDQEIECDVTTYRLDDLDRAIAESADYGFVKVLTEPGKDRILGVTIVGANAGEMLPEFVLAMNHGLGLNKIMGTIHVYPTWSEGNKFAAGEWKKANKPEKLLAWAERYFSWLRGTGAGKSSARKRPLLVALTGGIASGKTAVSDGLAKLGATVIDTDLIAREVVAPGTPGLERIVASFGNDMLNENGSLNRSGLRERVFADPQDRKLLEAITHPLIEGEVKARIAAADQADYIVLVVPLLVESGLFSDADKVVVVDVPEDVQIERLTARDDIDDYQAQAMIRSQASRESRLDIADYVIDNRSSLANLEKQIQTLDRTLRSVAV